MESRKDEILAKETQLWQLSVQNRSFLRSSSTTNCELEPGNALLMDSIVFYSALVSVLSCVSWFVSNSPSNAALWPRRRDFSVFETHGRNGKPRPRTETHTAGTDTRAEGMERCVLLLFVRSLPLPSPLPSPLLSSPLLSLPSLCPWSRCEIPRHSAAARSRRADTHPGRTRDCGQRLNHVQSCGCWCVCGMDGAPVPRARCAATVPPS